MKSVVIYTPSRWIIECVCDLISTIINFCILHSELKQRRKTGVTFTTRWFKLLSISCIISGFLQQLFSLLVYMPILCIFVGFISLTCWGTQLVFMGYYQLFRLYYCFANSQIHSNKGYPKQLFIIMYACGTVEFILYTIFYFLYSNASSLLVNNKCGIKDNFFFYAKPIRISISGNANAIMVVGLVASLGYLFWDIGILLLYIVKIRAFRKFKHSDPTVYSRLMSILHKITILTLSYQFTTVFAVIIFWAMAVAFGKNSVFFRLSVVICTTLTTTATNYSMYLMMDHNKKQYYKFLKTIYNLKLHWLCCCCGFMVIEQLLHEDVGVKYLEENIKQAEEQTHNMKPFESEQTYKLIRVYE